MDCPNRITRSSTRRTSRSPRATVSFSSSNQPTRNSTARRRPAFSVVWVRKRWLMSNTKNSEQRAASSKQPKSRLRLGFYCLLLTAYCLLALGCRQDMQDQPRYEAYESSKSFSDGLSSRPYVEGTVARGFGNMNTSYY